MTCNTLQQCNFLYGFFNCQLPEDTIDIKVPGRTLNGIHSYRRDCNSLKSICSLWSSQVRPYASLLCKMEAYMKDKRNTQDPFKPSQVCPNRSRISPFSKKKSPSKRSRTMSKRENRKEQGGQKDIICPPSPQPRQQCVPSLILQPMQ